MECITSINSRDFNTIYAIMKASFPKAEIHPLKQQKAICERSDYCIYVIREVKEIIAFLCVYDVEEFHFMEFLATAANARNQGIGKKLLTTFMESVDRPIIFEVEKPTTPMAKRRIAFYERCNAHLYSHINYYQPSFHKEEDIELLLMSYPKRYPDECIERWIEILYNRVYHIKKEW